MNEEKLDDIYQILINNNFELSTENYYDILCTICKNILINAFRGPCECRYCLKCITKYLDGGSKYCIGNTNHCKVALLRLDQNIQSDEAITIKISEIIVKCPNKYCSFKDHLKNIENHFKNCSFQSVKCPFSEFGCKDETINPNKMNDHFDLNIDSHSKLLLKHVDQLNNQLTIINSNVENLENKNNLLTIKLNETLSHKNATEFDEINSKILTLNDERFIHRNECIKDHEVIYDLQRQVMAINENGVVSDMVNKQLKLEIKDLQIQREQIKTEFDNLNRDFLVLQNASNNWKQLLIEATLDAEKKNKNWTLKAEAKDKETIIQIEKINKTLESFRNENQLLIKKTDDLKNNGDKKQLEINKLNQNYTALEKVQRALKGETETLKSEEKRMKTATSDLETKLKSTNVELKKLITDFESLKKETSNRVKRSDELILAYNKKEADLDKINQFVLILNTKMSSLQKDIENFKLEESIRKSNLDTEFKNIKNSIMLEVNEVVLSLNEDNVKLKEELRLIKASDASVEVHYLLNCKLDSDEKFKAIEAQINKLQEESAALRIENESLKETINTLQLSQKEHKISDVGLLPQAGAHKPDLQFTETRQHPEDQDEELKFHSIPTCRRLFNPVPTHQPINLWLDQPNEFFWTVRDFQQTLEQTQNDNIVINSPLFYSHRPGYKMQLSLFPRGTGAGKGTHLSINFTIRRDKLSKDLPWPFQYKVTISVINQFTNKPHVSQSSENDILERPARSEPMKLRNPPIRFHKLIELEALMSNAELCKRGQLSIQCTLANEG